MLDEDGGIGREAEPFGSDFDPPDLAGLRFELINVDVGRRGKAAGDVAGQRDALGLLAVLVRFDLGDRCSLGKSDWRPGTGAHTACSGLTRGDLTGGQL